MPDLRLLSAIALLIIGCCFLIFSLRIRLTHPVNRVFTIGPFVTDAGLQLVLRHIPLIAILGVYALSTSLADVSYYARAHWGFSWDAANALSLVSSIMAIIASIYVVAVFKELFHSRAKKREKRDV